MKKLMILLILLIAFTVTGLTVQAETTPTTLVVHYYRYDDDYTNFNIWLWTYKPTSLGGIQHDFNSVDSDEFGAYISIDLSADYPTATTLGIIVKQGGWDGYREPGGDRYIDLEQAENIDGVVHAYIVQGSLDIGTSQADLNNNIPDYRAKILSATFETDMTIDVELTHVPELGYELYEGSSLLDSGQVLSTSFTLNPSSVDITKTYRVKIMFDSSWSVEKTVSLAKLYDTTDFENLFTYTGDLGVTKDDTDTVFRLWAPLADAVALNIYEQGHPEYDDDGMLSEDLTPIAVIAMDRIDHGAWETTVSENYDGKYYTFSVNNAGVINEVVDPYAYSTGANGIRGMIVDFNALNPDGWTYDDRPDTITHMTDYTVYELHVRDLTTHESWGGPEMYRGTFMGLSIPGTTYTEDDTTVTTGLDHIDELGVNAVQLLPIFDFGYVDEVQVALNPDYDNTFNWGYMPYNFNTLEGSYATNPFDGGTRITEFKTAVEAFHERDIRVIMDVVYNHTGESDTSNFNKIVPGYYHRLNNDGTYSNGSGTGNETASERAMMRKFMVDSVVFWATEYNLSGFRFDLMALHDVDTMNAISAALHAIDPTIVIYGEPWNGGSTPLSDSEAAGKENIVNLNNVGAFNDNTRDGIKGSVFEQGDGGWVQGIDDGGFTENVKYGIVGGIDHIDVNVDAWHGSPTQTINYVSAHDNNTLHDKLRLTHVRGDALEAQQIQANAIILTSQGIPFLHAGVEFMRSKPDGSGGYDHNSYESPDAVNQLRWDRKLDNIEVFEYYKQLIAIRAAYNHFRLPTAALIEARLTFLNTDAGNEGIAYRIEGAAGEPEIIVIHSGHPDGAITSVSLTAGKTYRVLTNTLGADLLSTETITTTAYVPSSTTMILVESTENPTTIIASEVTVAKDADYDPMTNISVANDTADVYTSSYIDTSIPGRYTVAVLTVESYGMTYIDYFTLYVEGYMFDVTIIGGA